MGYFDGLTDAAFKTDAEGRTVFYPWSIFGRGRILADPAKAAAVRLLVRRYYQVVVPIICIMCGFTVTRSRRLLAALAIGSGSIILISSIFFYWKLYRLLAGTPLSNERLSLGQGYKNAARGLNRPMLWSGFIIMLGAAVVSLVVGIKGIWFRRVISFAMFGLFVFCTGAYAYMLRSKDN